MVEERGADLESVLVQEQARGEGGGVQGLPPESPAAAELGRSGPSVRVDLGRPHHEVALVVGHQVPGVGGELVLDLVDEPGWPEEVEDLVPSQEEPQQGVEPGEVVHVGVGDEGVAHLQDLPRGERGEVPEVEQQRPLLEEEVDVEPRIPERVVDQPGMEERLHGEKVPRLGDAHRLVGRSRRPVRKSTYRSTQ